MTFKESEHVNILEKLFQLSEQDLPLDRVIKETAKLTQRIPLYPGLVLSCLNSLTENVTIEDINIGDQILINQNDESIYGIVSEKLPDGFILDDVKITKKLNSFKVKLKKSVSKPTSLLLHARMCRSGEIDRPTRIIRFKQNVLEKLWPSLMFDKDKERKDK